MVDFQHRVEVLGLSKVSLLLLLHRQLLGLAAHFVVAVDGVARCVGAELLALLRLVPLKEQPQHLIGKKKKKLSARTQITVDHVYTLYAAPGHAMRDPPRPDTLTRAGLHGRRGLYRKSGLSVRPGHTCIYI